MRTLLRADAELSNGTIGRLCGMDPSNVSRIRSEMEAKGEAKAADVTTGLDGRVRQKPPRTERQKTARKVTSQHPSNGEGPQFLPLPQPTVCGQAKHESLSLASVAAQPSAADERVLLNQRAAANGSVVETEEGCLECSSLKLKLVQAVSARNGCWEWLAKDEQGNHYLVSCHRVNGEDRMVG